MAYIKIADTEHGELGHDGWTWVLNNPYDHEDSAHPAYYEETGLLTTDSNGRNYEVNFRPILRTTRGGLQPRPEINISITDAQAAAGMENRKAYDAIHKPKGGWRVILD